MVPRADITWLMFLEAALWDELFDIIVHGYLVNKAVHTSCYCRSPGMKFVYESWGL